MTVREACRRRMPLDGADSQALEYALQQLEREKAALEVENERLRNLSVWGTTEVIGPKYDRIQNLEAGIKTAIDQLIRAATILTP